MSNDLLYHYEKELAFLKERADEFAKQHPVVAEGLRLEPNSIEDPLVKQLLSGVAFLNARVQQKFQMVSPSSQMLSSKQCIRITCVLFPRCRLYNLHLRAI